jgi:glycosyltransferase involved in cell wall biosynthesis
MGVQDKVQFVGVLDEACMVRQYLGSHLFVSASTVENESNSLSEARLLGVPVVASYVGGIVDRIEHGVTGFLYQHDAHYMLAHYVTALFRDPGLCREFSARERAQSLTLNDPQRNAQLLRDAYARIVAHETPRR